MAIQIGDFVEVDYTGFMKSNHAIFDTTMEDVAKKAGLSEKAKYGSVIIVVGEHHVVKGLDNFMIGKEPGSYHVDIPDIEAFGKKSSQLLRLIPQRLFKQQNIEPFPGLEINIDGGYGIVKTVSGGRIIVDFNHPLASQDLHYDLIIKRIVSESKEKVDVVAKLLGVQVKDISVDGENVILAYTVEISEEARTLFSSELQRLVKLTLA